jgi:hypothetical protein
MDTVSAATTSQSDTISSETTCSTVSTTQKPVTSCTTNKISLSSINLAAKKINNYILVNHKLPDYVTISGHKVTMPQYLDLVSSGLLKIKYKSTKSVVLRRVNYPNIGVETGKSGNIKSKEYISISKSLHTYIGKYHKIPTIKNTSKGKFVYGTLIFTLNKVLNFRFTQKRLPKYVSIQPWTSIIRGTPVYITSDCITNIDVDTARINAIVNGLRARGLYAQNFGIGPNKHIEVIKSSSVPKNALVVNIYGGACAGTIYEMGLSWYKSVKGTRQVLTVFWPTAALITGLNFLPRSRDDDFTPLYGQPCGFPDICDLNRNGIYETGLPGREDGLACPDIYLHNNGYKYLYSYDINQIIQTIYKMAYC